jgi:hypothetical protein
MTYMHYDDMHYEKVDCIGSHLAQLKVHWLSMFGFECPLHTANRFLGGLLVFQSGEVTSWCGL